MMKLAGLLMVRNAADIIALNLLHHLHSGVDRMYVVDNGSTDGTDIVLSRIASRYPVAVFRDDGPFLQAELVTELARVARRDGAQWVLPIDGDEFWWTAGGDLGAELARFEAGAVRCEVIQFVQKRSVLVRTPDALLAMTHRANRIGEECDARRNVELQHIAFVEIPFPAKWISRSGPSLAIHRGNHEVSGIAGEAVTTRNIQCLHAALRARNILSGEKVDHANRLEVVESAQDVGWQARRWRRMSSSQLEAEWAANSHEEGVLDVYGVPRPLRPDLRLRDAVARWIDHELVRISPVDVQQIAVNG